MTVKKENFKQINSNYMRLRSHRLFRLDFFFDNSIEQFPDRCHEELKIDFSHPEQF
jgi:hypothetical protein